MSTRSKWGAGNPRYLSAAGGTGRVADVDGRGARQQVEVVAGGIRKRRRAADGVLFVDDARAASVDAVGVIERVVQRRSAVSTATPTVWLTTMLLVRVIRRRPLAKVDPVRRSVGVKCVVDDGHAPAGRAGCPPAADRCRSLPY